MLDKGRGIHRGFRKSLKVLHTINIEASGFPNLEFVVEKDALNKLSHMIAALVALF